MTVHFAAARCATLSPIARALAKQPVGRAANDNGDAAPVMLIDAATREALLHFAAHGLGAAHTAQLRAEQAHETGDQPGYEHWLGLCRSFDRRLAARLERRHEGEDALIH